MQDIHLELEKYDN